MRKHTKAEAVALLAKLKTIDPVHVFFEVASKTQREILADRTIYRCVSSSNQGGKTTTAIVECAAIARGVHPDKPFYGPINICVFVPSRAQASGVWGDRLLKASDIRVTRKIGDKEFNIAKHALIPEHEVEQIVWAYSPQGKYPGYIRLKNGSTIRLALSGDPKSWERVQGFTYDQIYRDEAVGNENLGAELFPRLAAAQTEVENGSRPWGGGILWVATETLVNEEFMQFLDNCRNNAPGYKLFFIDPSENKAVSMTVRDNMHAAMVKMSGSGTAALRMYGVGSAVDSLIIYPAFDYKRHVVPDYDPSPMDNIWMGWDPGIKDEYGLLFWAINRERPNTIRVLDFLHERGRTLDYQAQQAAEYLKGRTLEGIICDPNAQKRDHSRGKSEVALFMEILQEQLKVQTYRGVLMGRNIIKDGVEMMRRYLDPDPNDPSAEPLMLINERAMFVAQQLAKARVKNGCTTLAFNTIEGKNLEVFDLTRYIVSRQPYFHERSPNNPKWSPLTASAVPRVYHKPSPFDIHDGMSEAERTHVLRLRESSKTMEDLFGATGMGGNQMPVQMVNW